MAYVMRICCLQSFWVPVSNLLEAVRQNAMDAAGRDGWDIHCYSTNAPSAENLRQKQEISKVVLFLVGG